MKKKEYIKPEVETIEIGGVTIMAASDIESDVTPNSITEDRGFGAKENTFDVWE